MSKKHRLLSCSLSSLLCLSSCAEYSATTPSPAKKIYGQDADFSYFEPNALVAPDPSAIIGQWYNYVGPNTRITQTLLISPDGTCLLRSAFKGDTQEISDLYKDNNLPGTWTYIGNGSWQITCNQVPNFCLVVRTTGEVLLTYNDSAAVSERVVWVKADDEAAVMRERATGQLQIL